MFIGKDLFIVSIFLFVYNCRAISQTINGATPIPLLIKGPRNKEFANYPGRYSVLAEVNAIKFKPGDSIRIACFISGYGVIQNSKIDILPSTDIFDKSKSFLAWDLGRTQDTLIYGRTKMEMPRGGGYILSLSGGLNEKWWEEPKPTMFFDIDTIPESLTISTEKYFYQPPLKILYYINKSAPPGDYNIDITFTYFNGSIWCSDNKQISFHVENIYEINEWILWIAAILACVPALDTLHRIKKGAEKKIKKWFSSEKNLPQSNNIHPVDDNDRVIKKPLEPIKSAESNPTEIADINKINSVTQKPQAPKPILHKKNKTARKHK